MGGDDNWQPDQLCEACEAPKVAVSEGKLTWQAVPYAICYVVTKNGQVVGFTTDTSFDYEQDAVYTVQAANEQGGLSLPGQPGTAVSISDAHAASVAAPAAVFTVDGRQHSQMQRGVNIVRMADGTVRKLMK